jgi:hypothetical protein
MIFESLNNRLLGGIGSTKDPETIACQACIPRKTRTIYLESMGQQLSKPIEVKVACAGTEFRESLCAVSKAQLPLGRYEN